MKKTFYLNAYLIVAILAIILISIYYIPCHMPQMKVEDAMYSVKLLTADQAQTLSK